MIKHTHTEPSEINFKKLEERILQINDTELGQFESMNKMIKELIASSQPTLIVATGGSKVIAYYLKLVLEVYFLCEVIEPRDYFYKPNRDMFSNLIVISASGKTNGIEECLNQFSKNKYLICEKENGENVIAWGNKLYEREKSFISLATTLGPIALLLDCITAPHLDLSSDQIQKVNDKIKVLFERSIQIIERLKVNFQDTSCVQIMSGYETEVSSKVLESNLVEAGVMVPVIHDKGSYCHGRSNLLFQYPNSHVIYLSHGLKELDDVLLDVIQKNYNNLSIFDTHDFDDNIFWKEYYLMIQMYLLSNKMAQDRGIDLTQPEYHPELVKTLYHFKGGM